VLLKLRNPCLDNLTYILKLNEKRTKYRMRVHLYNQWRTFIVITLLYLCLLYEHLLGLADDSRVDKMY